MKYKTKPCEIEAVEYTGQNGKEILNFMNSTQNEFDEIIPTLEGNMKVSVGDYVIKGLRGEFYPCKPDIFKKKYEPV